MPYTLRTLANIAICSFMLSSFCLLSEVAVFMHAYFNSMMSPMPFVAMSVSAFGFVFFMGLYYLARSFRLDLQALLANQETAL